MRIAVLALVLASSLCGCRLPHCLERKWVHVPTYTNTTFIMVGQVMLPMTSLVPEHDEQQCTRWEWR